MPAPEGERIARMEGQIEDLRGDIQELRDAARADHHRLRAVEGAVQKLIDSQAQARQGEERQYKRLEMRIQILTLVVIVAEAVSTITFAMLH